VSTLIIWPTTKPPVLFTLILVSPAAAATNSVLFSCRHPTGDRGRRISASSAAVGRHSETGDATHFDVGIAGLPAPVALVGRYPRSHGH
jgi:hypothetical protein